MCYTSAIKERSRSMLKHRVRLLAKATVRRSAMVEQIIAEEWRPVPGHNGVYDVSSLGRFRRALDGPRLRAGKPIRTYLRKNGYFQINLSLPSPRVYLTHRLVAAAFLGPRCKGMFVNHKNGVRGDNRIGNLEWVTRHENMQHAMNVLGVHHGENGTTAILTNKQAIEIYRLKNTGITAETIGKKYGVSDKTVYNIWSRATWRRVTSAVATMTGGASDAG